MLVVMAFHPGDIEQALRFAIWTKELGRAQGHDLLLVKDTTCDPIISEEIRSQFAASFDSVEVMDFVDHFRRWPDAPNAIFGMVARHIRNNKPQPWLFCEPDCVPLKPGWLDLLWAEYQEAGKPFLGDFVSVHTPEIDVIDHCSGNAIYPGDMMQHAGSALIAGDLAWDVMAAAEIVPKMHRSKLIHHSWKSPGFADWQQFEREVLAFKPDCCLFHADKSGSLYPLLREHRNLPAPVLAEEAIAEANGPEARESTKKPTVVLERDADSRGGQFISAPDHNPTSREAGATGAGTFTVFVKTWPPDYEFLRYCLRSFERFTCGFHRCIIVSSEVGIPNPDPSSFEEIIEPEATGEDGYLRQQVRKLYADQCTDTSYIIHIDSDTIFTRPVTPQTYFTDGKIDWMMTPYAMTETPWQPITEKFLGRPVEFEFMRRAPQVLPRWIYAAIRDFCVQKHGRTLEQYVMEQPHRAFSEYNAVGAFAYYFHRNKFNWINTAEVRESEWPTLTVLQKNSWGGLTPEIQAEFETILKGGDALRTNAIAVSEEDMECTNSTVPPLSSAALTFKPDSAANFIALQEPVASESAHSLTLTKQWPCLDITLEAWMGQTPWQSRADSLAEIRNLAERLKNFCGKASYVRAVRLELHKLGVIELPYRFKRRKGKWRSKKK